MQQEGWAVSFALRATEQKSSGVMKVANPINHWSERRIVREEGCIVVRKMATAEVPERDQGTIEAHALGYRGQEELRALVERLSVTSWRRGRRWDWLAQIDRCRVADHGTKRASNQLNLSPGHMPFGGHRCRTVRHDGASMGIKWPLNTT